MELLTQRLASLLTVKSLVTVILTAVSRGLLLYPRSVWNQ